MDLKQTWVNKISLEKNYIHFFLQDEILPTMIENTSFISDDDLEEFFLLNTQIEMKRAQLREFFKFKYQTWQQQILYKNLNFSISI